MELVLVEDETRFGVWVTEKEGAIEVHVQKGDFVITNDFLGIHLFPFPKRKTKEVKKE